MLKLMFIALSYLIEQGNTGVKTIDWFNLQYDFNSQKHPFAMPAVFIEFETIDGKSVARNMQLMEVVARFHIVTDHHKDMRRDNPRADAALAHFELCDKMHRALHNKAVKEDSVSNNGQQRIVISGLSRTRIETDHDFTNQLATVMSYRLLAYDCSASPETDLWQNPENKLVIC